MAPRNVQRQGFVKALRQLGRACGVRDVPTDNNVGQGRVADLVAGILATAGVTEEQRVQALALQDGYTGTFQVASGRATGTPTADMAGTVDAEDAGAWQFKAAQLTYNHSSGEWASADQVVLARLWDRFKAFGAALAAEWGALGLTMTMERSKQTDAHVHTHLYFHLQAPFRRRGRHALAVLAFEGIQPHVSPNTASGSSYKGAVDYGHFYVWVEKVGSLFVSTACEPWCDYAVQGWWLDNLLKAGKLDRGTYLTLAAKVTVGFQKRLMDVRAAERFEQSAAVHGHVRTESVRLAERLAPMKAFPEVEQCVALFDTQSFYHRRPILAIIGGTNLGKSLLARHVLLRVAERLGLKDFLEVTVEMMQTLDLADFDLRVHGGVLLDGVGDALTLKLNREALQGRPKVCKGAKSATNVYAYDYSFCRRGIVATFDLSAQHLEAFQTDHWLSNALNVIVLQLSDKAYEDAPLLPVADAPGSPEAVAVERRLRKRRSSAASEA